MEVDSNSGKWVAGAGTTAMSIIGDVLGGAAVLGLGANGNGGGLFGGGGNSQAQKENADLKSQLARMEAEKYTDAAIFASRTREAEINEKLYEFAIDKDKELALLKAEVQCMQKQIELENKLYDQRLDTVAATATIGIQNNNNAIQQLANTVASFTKVVIPQTSVCNTGTSTCNCSNS